MTAAVVAAAADPASRSCRPARGRYCWSTLASWCGGRVGLHVVQVLVDVDLLLGHRLGDGVVRAHVGRGGGVDRGRDLALAATAPSIGAATSALAWMLTFASSRLPPFSSESPAGRRRPRRAAGVADRAAHAPPASPTAPPAVPPPSPTAPPAAPSRRRPRRRGIADLGACRAAGCAVHRTAGRIGRAVGRVGRAIHDTAGRAGDAVDCALDTIGRTAARWGPLRHRPPAAPPSHPARPGWRSDRCRRAAVRRRWRCR